MVKIAGVGCFSVSGVSHVVLRALPLTGGTCETSRTCGTFSSFEFGGSCHQPICLALSMSEQLRSFKSSFAPCLASPFANFKNPLPHASYASHMSHLQPFKTHGGRREIEIRYRLAWSTDKKKKRPPGAMPRGDEICFETAKKRIASDAPMASSSMFFVYFRHGKAKPRIHRQTDTAAR